MYAIPNVRVVSHSFEGPLRVSALRSLGAFANVVAIECTMEALAGKNPLDFRIDHLEDSRAVAVLEELGRLTAGRKGLGYGFSRYKNEACYCGVAARVADGRLAELWAVADAGEVINSDGLANQIEGGMIQAASWTLKEQVGPRRSDWADYPILGFTEAPEVHVSLIDRPGEPFLGAGEAAAGPAGAAILNAFSLAVGERLTTLPLRRS